MNQELRERLRKISERLKKEYRAEEVILYGSQTKEEAGEDSDVDLLIIAPTEERFFRRMATVLRLIRDLRNGMAVEPIVLTSSELQERVDMGDQFIKGILEEGVRL